MVHARVAVPIAKDRTHYPPDRNAARVVGLQVLVATGELLPCWCSLAPGDLGHRSASHQDLPCVPETVVSPGAYRCPHPAVAGAADRAHMGRVHGPFEPDGYDRGSRTVVDISPGTCACHQARAITHTHPGRASRSRCLRIRSRTAWCARAAGRPVLSEMSSRRTAWLSCEAARRSSR